MSYVPRNVFQRAALPVRRASIPRRTFGEFPPPPWNQGLGILPLVAAAAPSVTNIIKNALGSVLSGLDPGKKRDAERQARAQMYENLAVQGSITAANRVYSASIGIHGGEGPTKEANWYKAAWSHIAAAVPDIAQKVLTLPRVGLPDPQRPELAPADLQRIQEEINVYHGVVSQATSAAGKALAGFPGGTVGLVLALGVGLAFLRGNRR